MKTASKKLRSKLPSRIVKPAESAEIKDFDSAKTMRAIRDKISKEIMDMTFEEEKAYLEKLLAKKTA